MLHAQVAFLRIFMKSSNKTRSPKTALISAAFTDEERRYLDELSSRREEPRSVVIRGLVRYAIRSLHRRKLLLTYEWED